jgi:hypothetical protein
MAGQKSSEVEVTMAPNNDFSFMEPQEYSFVEVENYKTMTVT